VLAPMEWLCVPEVGTALLRFVLPRRTALFHSLTYSVPVNLDLGVRNPSDIRLHDTFVFRLRTTPDFYTKLPFGGSLYSFVSRFFPHSAIL